METDRDRQRETDRQINRERERERERERGCCKKRKRSIFNLQETEGPESV